MNHFIITFSPCVNSANTSFSSHSRWNKVVTQNVLFTFHFREKFFFLRCLLIIANDRKLIKTERILCKHVTELVKYRLWKCQQKDSLHMSNFHFKTWFCSFFCDFVFVGCVKIVILRHLSQQKLNYLYLSDEILREKNV